MESLVEYKFGLKACVHGLDRGSGCKVKQRSHLDFVALATSHSYYRLGLFTSCLHELASGLWLQWSL